MYFVIKRIIKIISSSIIFSYCIAAIAFIYSWLLFLTCRLAIQIDEEARAILSSKGSCIVLAWHSRLFIWPQFMRRFCRCYAVVSSHRDGSHIARFIQFFGHKAIRGSSRKGGFTALSQLIRAIKAQNIVCITPDGPIGPRFQINSNIVAIAEKLSVPILIFSYSASNAKILNTWDTFMCPLPFSRLFIRVSLSKASSLKNLEALSSFMVEDMQKADKMSNIKVYY